MYNFLCETKKGFKEFFAFFELLNMNLTMGYNKIRKEEENSIWKKRRWKRMNL